MHASDRYLLERTVEDLREQEERSVGDARRLRDGEIGKGLYNYDAIVRTLYGVVFDDEISVEEGVDGMDQLRRCVTFLPGKLEKHFGMRTL